MRLGTCVALELVVGVSLVAGLGVSVTWGVNEVRHHWQREARAAQDSRTMLAQQTPASVRPTEPSRTELALRSQDTGAGMQPDRAAMVQPGVAPAGRHGIASPESSQLAAREGSEVHGAASGTLLAATRPGSAVIAPDRAIRHERPIDYNGLFNGVRDDLLLEPLHGSAVKKVKFNRGGSSISLRIEFENGARAAFKPQQTAMQTVPRREIAAYRIDRLLGINAVSPAVARKFNADELFAAVVESSQVFVPRLQEEMKINDGEVKGELSWWIPIIRKARINGYEIDTTDGIVTWKRHLTATKDTPDEWRSLLAQISSMVLFDFIINNPDRWSGANARVSDDQATLYFMDNTMSFGADPEGHRKCRIYLKRSQKFSRSLVDALRRLTIEDVTDVVSRDHEPFAFLLTKQEIEALMSRRDLALAYIDELIEEHGEDKILVFP